MQPEASDSPATRPKASHCRRERRAVTSRSLPPECPAWVSPSAHPEMSCRPGAALQRTSARVLQRSPRHMPRCRHLPGLLALPRSRLLASARRLSRVWPARGRGGITTRAGTYPMATRGCPMCCFGLDASARRRERRARRMRRIGDPSHRQVRATRWPNRGHARSGSARHQLETSELEKTCWPSEPSGRPFGGTPRRIQPTPPPTHKPTTKQPFENLLSEKKRTVNLFLRSLLLG